MEEWQEDHSPEGGRPSGDDGLFGRMNNWFLLIYAVACYLLASSLAGLLYLGGNVVLSVILPGIFGYVLPLMVLTSRYRLSFSGELRLLAPDAVTSLIVLVVAAAAIYPVDALSWLFERGRPADNDYINILLAFKPKGFWHFVGMALGLGIITPLGEELLYRGVIQSVFHRNMGVFTSIFLSSLVFGASHGTLYVIPGVTAMGLLLALVFYRTGNLTYPVMIHAVFNLFSLYRLSRMSEETIREFDWSGPSIAVTLISGVVLVAAVAALELRARTAGRRE